MAFLMRIPEHVQTILSKLKFAGYEAYLVGGCVRDAFIGKAQEASDYDIATSATPHETKLVLSIDGVRFIDTGIKHGTLSVLIGKQCYEVTTFRTDGVYDDFRRPSEVEFVSSIDADLSRRDFTINAMAYNPDVGLVDPFCGQVDIKAGIIKCVGNPKQRICEDALRIMRALRFSAQLGFEIDASLKQALLDNRLLLKKIAAERITAELDKLLVAKNAAKILQEFASIFAVFIPEIAATVGFEQKSRYHIYDVWQHTVHAIDRSANDLSARLTLLFHDLGKPQCFFVDKENRGHFYGHNKIGKDIATKRLTALRYPKKIVEDVAQIIKYHQIDLKPENVHKWLAILGHDQLKLLIAVKRGDFAAHALHVANKEKHILDACEVKLADLIAVKACVSRDDLVADGNDLKAIGIVNGKEIGRVLNYLLESVVDGSLENDRESLLLSAEEYYNL